MSLPIFTHNVLIESLVASSFLTVISLVILMAERSWSIPDWLPYWGSLPIAWGCSLPSIDRARRLLAGLADLWSDDRGGLVSPLAGLHLVADNLGLIRRSLWSILLLMHYTDRSRNRRQGVLFMASLTVRPGITCFMPVNS